jgi:hypothetical protein
MRMNVENVLMSLLVSPGLIIRFDPGRLLPRVAICLDVLQWLIVTQAVDAARTIARGLRCG